MKTILASAVALAALTGVALANDRTEEGTAAWRNVHNGAVWANEPVNTDVQALAAPSHGSQDQSDFALRKLRGETFGNDN